MNKKFNRTFQRNEILRAFLYGATFVLTFIVVEGVIASRTRWGIYNNSLGLFWNTPFFLIPVWWLIVTGLAMINTGLERLFQWKAVKRMLVVFLGMTICAWLGEGVGAWMGWWSFSPTPLTWLYVPIWIPISYGLAFSFCPWLARSKFGGLMQAILVAISWVVVQQLLAWMK